MTQPTEHHRIEGAEIMSPDDMVNIREALIILRRHYEAQAARQGSIEDARFYTNRAAEIKATEVKTHSIYVDGE